MKFKLVPALTCIVIASLASHAAPALMCEEVSGHHKEGLESPCREIVIAKMTAFATEKLGENIVSCTQLKVKKSSRRSDLSNKSKGKVTMRLNGKKFSTMIHDDNGHCFLTNMKMK